MKVKIREIGNVRVVDLEGELKLGAGDTALRETVRGLVSQGHSRIVLNLRGVKWIDSSGVGELVACRKRTVERGGGAGHDHSVYAREPPGAPLAYRHPDVDCAQRRLSHRPQ